MVKKGMKMIVLLGMVFVVFCPSAYAKNYDVNIITGDNLVNFPDGRPFISDSNRTMVPIRFVSESLGMQVNWRQEEQEVILKGSDVSIKFKVGEQRAFVNGREKVVDAPSILEGNRTYVPLRFISEVIGYRVTWVEALKAAFIYDDGGLDYGAIANRLVKSITKGDTLLDMSGFPAGQQVIPVIEKFNAYINDKRLVGVVLDNRLMGLQGENFTHPLPNPKYKADELMQKLWAAIAEIIKPGMSDYQKALAVHDYIVLNTAYDEENLLKGTIPRRSHEAEGVLLHGKAVCDGYAKAFKLFMDSLAIDCEIVTGTANGSGHAWNQVKLGGDWYNIDVTWDDPLPDEPGRVVYHYFNITDEELAIDHVWDRSKAHSCTATRYDYYMVSDLFFESADALYQAIESWLQAGKQTFAVKIKGFEFDDQRLKNLIFKYASEYSYRMPLKNAAKKYQMREINVKYRAAVKALAA